MADAPYVVNVTTRDFMAVVVDGSRQRPVLVDFWADWCAPCRILAPILDKIAAELGGKLLVAKVNTEQEQALAAQLGIRSLPTVRLFRDGQPVDEFMGALPESEVRRFLDRHLPRESDQLLDKAEALLARGRVDQAVALVERAQADDPSNPRTLLAYARVKAVVGDYNAAERALDALPLPEHNSAEATALRAHVAFDRVAAGAPAPAVLERRLAADPSDSEARYQLAAHRVIAGEHEQALEGLLTLLRRDRAYGDDAARRGMIQVFDLLGGSGELVSRYRARLTSALF
jgi:putative thioredoxin